MLWLAGQSKQIVTMEQCLTTTAGARPSLRLISRSVVLDINHFSKQRKNIKILGGKKFRFSIILFSPVAFLTNSLLIPVGLYVYFITCPLILITSTAAILNSFLIPVGMYVYSITYPLILITSPAAILNLPINLFSPLEALVLTSNDFHSVSLHSSPLLSCTYSSGTVLNLSRGAIFTLYSHTFTLFWTRKAYVIVDTFQLGFCVFKCVFHQERVSFFFAYCCYPYFDTFLSTFSIYCICSEIFLRKKSLLSILA